MVVAEVMAYLFLDLGRHGEAVEELEAVLRWYPAPVSAGNDFPYGSLMMACHYAGHCERAVHYGQLAVEQLHGNGDVLSEAHCLRFLGEIQLRLGDFAQALASCEAALDLRRRHAVPASQIADTLYWKARSLFRLQRLQETEQTVLDALGIWQEEENRTGVGFCLRLLGQVRSAQGRFTEARAHLEYAVLLHQHTGIEVNRIAATEALGDVLWQQGQWKEARTLYAECLAFYQSGAMGFEEECLHERLRLLHNDATQGHDHDDAEKTPGPP